MKKCIMTSTTLVALAVVRICGFASNECDSHQVGTKNASSV